jgi:hypothetical protein
MHFKPHEQGSSLTQPKELGARDTDTGFRFQIARLGFAWGGGVSIARAKKGTRSENLIGLSSLKHVDDLPRRPSTTARGLHPASR